jgi:hypothetical protein
MRPGGVLQTTLGVATLIGPASCFTCQVPPDEKNKRRRSWLGDWLEISAMAKDAPSPTPKSTLAVPGGSCPLTRVQRY